MVRKSLRVKVGFGLGPPHEVDAGVTGLGSGEVLTQLAAGPHIKDGPRTGHYTEQPGQFPGGYKTISPGDVADFLVRQIENPVSYTHLTLPTNREV